MLGFFHHIVDLSTLGNSAGADETAEDFRALPPPRGCVKLAGWPVPFASKRKEKRSCPALGRSICSVCCGTKRLVEINCPPDCPHLAASREHPAAVVRRQQEADVAALLPSMGGLTERQHQLFFLFQSVIAKFRPDGLARLTDEDVAEAAGACAATIETAAKGVLYEHAPGHAAGPEARGRVPGAPGAGARTWSDRLRPRGRHRPARHRARRRGTDAAGRATPPIWRSWSGCCR